MRRILPLFFLLTIINRCVFAQQISPGDISVFLAHYRSDLSKSLVDKKVDALSVYHADDVRIMTEFQRTIIGKGPVAMYYKLFISRFNVSQYEKVPIEVLDAGRMIIESGRLKIAMTLKTSGKNYTIDGKYIDIWEKSGPKQMQLVTTAWNYNHDIEDSDQFRFNDVAVTDVALKPHLPINDNITFELSALNRMMEATVSQHDAKIWSLFYTDDAMIFHSRTDLSIGRKAVDQYLDAHCKELPVFEKLDVRNDRIDNLGTYIIEYASHVAIWRAGEYSGVGLGKDLAIWRREKDGSLKIFRHIGMYD